MKKVWNHKKHGKNWKSRYERDARGERVFVLEKPRVGKVRHITFESWQAAVALGWIKA